MNRASPILSQSLLIFLVRYRRTAIGPLWLLVGPALFITVIGGLYARIGAHPVEEFVPYLAIGLVYWTLISGFVNASPMLFVRNRARLMQGSMNPDEIVYLDLANTFIAFAHQCLIILIVLFIYPPVLNWSLLLAIIGLGFGLINGYWINVVFGILGARYRDLAEVFSAIMRIAFLATPIIWMPGGTGRGGALGVYLSLNPFYHFLEVFRAPLLGKPVELYSWLVVIGFTVAGLVFARFMRAKFGHLVPLWI